jgi:phosphate acyltransferase
VSKPSPGRPVALDAMGGDNAPAATVAGALRAQRDHGVAVLLVGRPDRIGDLLRAEGAEQALPVVAAPDVVAMEEEPALALRTKPDASVRVAARLVAAGEASALVSAGSTGATVAAALLELGRLPGVRRPVVAVVLPTPGRDVVLLDCGAVPDVQPDMLRSYAQMGGAYARVRGADQPRVGLLNVGAEAGKGNQLAKASYDLLAGSDGFVGNVEPDEVLAGTVDVVVTDGFTGNVFLKTVEACRQHGPGPGAAVLLGVQGEVFVAHGAADERAVAAALHTAAAAAAAGLSGRVGTELGDG